MRKQEYLYIHALLVEVIQYHTGQKDMPAGIPAEYKALDARPMDVNESKQNHYDAIKMLANTIEIWLEQTSDTRQKPKMADQ